MTKNIDKIKEKLMKLKALSKSTNENEMLSAISMMKKIQNQYGLTDADIPDIETGVLKVERAEIFKHKKQKYSNEFENFNTMRKLKNWEKRLAGSIARAYDCVLTFGKFSLQFYGFKEDVIIANEMYMWILNTMKIAAKRNFEKFSDGLSPIVYHQSFMIGVTEAVELKAYQIEEEKELTLEAVESELLAEVQQGANQLAIVKKKTIEDFIGDIKSISLEISASNYMAKCTGYNEADKISLRRQVNDRTVKGALE